MDKHGLTAASISPLIKKEAGTINNWRSNGVPERDSVRAHVTAFMEQYDAERDIEAEHLDVINLEISAERFDAWNRAALAEGKIIRDWAVEGLDRLAKAEFAKIASFESVSLFELPLFGLAAAGSPIVSQLVGETVAVPKKFPDGYFVIEVNGHSMEPTLPDGCRIVCEPREYIPKHGKVCIISDGHGSSVKRYDGKRKAFVSDNPAFPDFTPVDEVKLQGYFVEILPEA
jgi:SOS-response transcriptional repressor LexA